MAKNLTPEIAKLLGVGIGEEFKIRDTILNKMYGNEYRFYENNLQYFSDDKYGWCNASYETLTYLIYGDYEIIKLPWKPKINDEYWTFDSMCYTEQCKTRFVWDIISDKWINHPSEIALLEKGWIFRTYEEAKEALPKVAEELGVEYEV